MYEFGEPLPAVGGVTAILKKGLSVRYVAIRGSDSGSVHHAKDVVEQSRAW